MRHSEVILEETRIEAEREMLAWVTRFRCLDFMRQADIFFTAQEVERGRRIVEIREAGLVKESLRNPASGPVPAQPPSQEP